MPGRGTPFTVATHRPHPHVSIFVWKGIFFPSGLAFHRSTRRSSWKQYWKMHLSKNKIQSGDFWKRWLFIYVWKDQNDAIQHTLLARCMLCNRCYCISIILKSSCRHTKTIWIHYVWMLFFLNWQKKSVFKNIRMHVDGANNRCINHCKIFQDLVSRNFSTLQDHPVCHNTYLDTFFETSSKSSNVFLDTWSQISICRGYNTNIHGN